MTDCPDCARYRAEIDALQREIHQLTGERDFHRAGETLLHGTAAQLAADLGRIRDALADLRRDWPDVAALERVLMSSTTCSVADLSEVQKAAHVLRVVEKISAP